VRDLMKSSPAGKAVSRTASLAVVVASLARSGTPRARRIRRRRSYAVNRQKRSAARRRSSSASSKKMLSVLAPLAASRLMLVVSADHRSPYRRSTGWTSNGHRKLGDVPLQPPAIQNRGDVVEPYALPIRPSCSSIHFASVISSFSAVEHVASKCVGILESAAERVQEPAASSPSTSGGLTSRSASLSAGSLSVADSDRSGTMLDTASIADSPG